MQGLDQTVKGASPTRPQAEPREDRQDGGPAPGAAGPGHTRSGPPDTHQQEACTAGPAEDRRGVRGKGRIREDWRQAPTSGEPDAARSGAARQTPKQPWARTTGPRRSPPRGTRERPVSEDSHRAPTGGEPDAARGGRPRERPPGTHQPEACTTR
ncbi:hypothetical protein ABZ902_16430, partial [Streptomyces massasporeus]